MHMKKQFNLISIITSFLWAVAIVAAAILKAPSFLTMMLLPILGFASLATAETIRRVNTRTLSSR
jgi:hypothetical protein